MADEKGPDTAEAPPQQQNLPAVPGTQRASETMNKLSKATGWSTEEVATLKASVAKGITDTEFAFYLFVCKQQQMDPFNKEVWCFKDNQQKLLIFTGRDGMLKKAQRDPRWNGFRSGCVREKDEFKMDLPNGVVHHVFSGNIATRGHVVGAWCKVFLRDRAVGATMEPLLVWVPWEQFNRNFGAWKTHPDEMIVKCAEAHAFKKAGGVSGLAIEEDYYVTADGVAMPFTPRPAEEQHSRNADAMELDVLKEKVTEALDSYTGDDREDIRRDVMNAVSNGTFTVEYARGVLVGLASNQATNVVDVPHEQLPPAEKPIVSGEAAATTNASDDAGTRA